MARVTVAYEVGDEEVPMAPVAKAYHDLEGCVTLLNEVVGEELLSIVV